LVLIEASGSDATKIDDKQKSARNWTAKKPRKWNPHRSDTKDKVIFHFKQKLKEKNNPPR
jgi:hypothetical protein